MKVTMVCTANLCRSPMAEGLLHKALADRGCHDIEVVSCGTRAGSNLPATREAIGVMSRLGIDISGHRSRPLDADRLASSDVIVAMTGVHVDEILAVAPNVASKVVLLKALSEPHAPENESQTTREQRLAALLEAPKPKLRPSLDVNDPIGLGYGAHERCATEIAGGIEVLAGAICSTVPQRAPIISSRHALAEYAQPPSTRPPQLRRKMDGSILWSLTGKGLVVALAITCVALVVTYEARISDLAAGGGARDMTRTLQQSQLPSPPANPGETRPSGRATLAVNRAGGYEFVRPRGWDLNVSGTVTRVSSPGGDALIALGIGPNGDLAEASRRFFGQIRSGYEVVGASTKRRVALSGGRAVALSGKAINSFDVTLSFDAIALRSGGRNYIIAAFRPPGADDSMIAEVERTIDSFCARPCAH